MKRIILFWLLTTVLLATGVATQAQQPAKVPRIGWLTSGLLSGVSTRNEAFRQGLRDLGYVEGKNIIVEWRGGEGSSDRLRAVTMEFVRLKVDAIVASSAGATRAAKQATSTIPIVMAPVGDPVGDGFVASLARPGGNITGLSTLSPELSGKRLEILKDTVPKLSRVAVFGTSTSASNAQELKEVELASAALAMKVQYFDVLAAKDIEAAFLAAAKQRADAILMNVSGGFMNFQSKEIGALAIKSKLPVIFHRQEYAEAGGLMSYGTNYLDLDRRAATFVHKILQGAKPADLPVEQPIKFEFVVNLQAAKAIGLTIPPEVLARANRVIR